MTTWVTSLDAEHNKTRTCNSLQESFEASFCIWKETQTSTCEAYEVCFEDALARSLQLASLANITERSSKADYIAAEQVLCKLAVLNASSPADKEEAQAFCNSLVVNTTLLDILYPSLVEKEVCVVPTEFPCMASWWEGTYAHAPWYGVVGMLPCSPCPGDTTTTTTTTSTTTTPAPGPPAVYSGRYHSIVVVNGTAFTFGRNDWGQLGDGTHGRKLKPVKVMEGVKSAAAGAFFTLLLKPEAGIGKVWVAGLDDVNAGPYTNEGTFVQFVQIGDVKKVAAGKAHAVLMTSDGVWTRGSNVFGQLGDGTFQQRSSPHRVLHADVSEACAGDHTVIINSSGAYGFGANYVGQLGIGDTINRSSPTFVMSDVQGCGAGVAHTVWLKNDGTAWTAGRNYLGQLGNGNNDDRREPVQVMSGVRSVFAGGYHTMFLKQDGTVWATGKNAYGQLGDGSLNSRTSPVRVMSSVISLSAGLEHTLFVKEDWTVWGAGDGGALGISDNGKQPTPVQVGWDEN